MMIAERMKPLVLNNSVIREAFEEGKRLISIVGAENVYDFSIGNPNVPAPEEVKTAILTILDQEDSTSVHGYMSNAGFEDVRETIAQSLNKRFDTSFSYRNILMTVGAAGGLNVILRTLLNPQDEVIVFAPYFIDHKNYVENQNGKLVVIPANVINFQPDLVTLEDSINENTKIVMINSPNNPTGVVYSAETLTAIGDILRKKEVEYQHGIVLISDEPYRELAYDGVEVPYVTKFYTNTIVCYSYSKSLSLPGERIGYLAIPDEVTDFEDVFAAASILNRSLGGVNAPSLMQKVIKYCIEHEVEVNVEAYDKNRVLLYESLIGYGFECIKPEGAFYLFVKSPEVDEKAFCAKAKELNILVVPGSSFACPGYVRIAYCVSYEQIERSLPAFKQLAQQYSLL